MKLLVLQLLLLVTVARSFTICSGVSEEDEDLTVELSQQVLACSRFLSCLLERLCSNSVKIVKGDGAAIFGKLKLSRNRRHASSSRELDEGSPRRTRRQVVDDCCLQPCTINDLLQYCPSKHENVTEEDT
ncbi:hypothetical protein JYU34_006561 [Plutella xylostella]|uniref:Insulin-like domain-containing protein n=1 Tax=Plutella xylostella TaxID=51655 RepID=A0ABQ7QSC6_PLUXY|nr:hypothetical protein JYU34_006561 [Plutella xylostella]